MATEREELMTWERYSGKLVHVTIKLPAEMLEVVDSLARRKKLSRSEIIRRAIYHYLSIENIKVESGYKYIKLNA